MSNSSSSVPRWIGGPAHGFWLWFATLGGIVLWMIHLVALSSLVELTCEYGAVVWVMHGLTVVLGGLTVLAGWMSWQLVRSRPGLADYDPGLDGRLRFMGIFGLLTEVISLLLIVWEGLYVPVIDVCR